MNVMKRLLKQAAKLVVDKIISELKKLGLIYLISLVCVIVILILTAVIVGAL